MQKITFLLIAMVFIPAALAAQEAKKFSDDLKTVVFTTKYVVDEKKEITYVSHDADDGAWEFLSNEIIKDYMLVAKVISLAEVIKMDPTVLELADMPLGYFAERKSKKDKWVIAKHE